MVNDRLKKQIDFIVEIDKVKNIIRKTKLFGRSRFENDAEHSWTISIMAALLKEYANFPVNIEKVIKMLLIHDVIEIDAGDTFLYSKERATVQDTELKAAERIFGILEDDQRKEFLDIWKEFEERKTNEAKFASVFDRLEPMLQNYINEGITWKKHGIKMAQVVEMNRHIADGSKELWKFAEFIINDSVEKGYLEK